MAWLDTQDLESACFWYTLLYHEVTLFLDKLCKCKCRSPGLRWGPIGCNDLYTVCPCLACVCPRWTRPYTQCVSVLDTCARAGHVHTRLQCWVCAHSCPTLCDPMDCSPTGSSVHGISQARTLEPVAVSYSRGSLRPSDRTHISCVSWIGRRLFTTAPCGKPEVSNWLTLIAVIIYLFDYGLFSPQKMPFKITLNSSFMWDTLRNADLD